MSPRANHDEADPAPGRCETSPPRRRRTRWPRRSPRGAAVVGHGGERCGLSVDERTSLGSMERALAGTDPGLALRLSGARAARQRAWLLSPGGTAAGAALLATGAVGAVWSVWFGLLLCVGAVPAVADVVETRRLHRIHRLPRPWSREDRSSEWT